MNINNLFTIADAAKMIQAYDIANSIFAVIAEAAITNQAFCHTRKPDDEATHINFQIETEDDDLIEILSDPNNAGYFALPRLVKWGKPLIGTSQMLESHVLCIPLPLVSRYYCNMMVRLMKKETYNMGSAIIDRDKHCRHFWRLKHDNERKEACRRDLLRRLFDEVSQDEIDEACKKILNQSTKTLSVEFAETEE